MVLAAIVLGLSGLYPFHHHNHHMSRKEVAFMQAQVEDLEQSVSDDLPEVRAQYGAMIPEGLYVALANDVTKLSKEKVTDKSFRQDFDKFGDDIDAMTAQINWITSVNSV